MLEITEIIIKADDIIDLETMLGSITDKMEFHKKKHPDFSVKIDTDFDKLEINLKTMYLGDIAN
jgi:hypothetical protein